AVKPDTLAFAEAFRINTLGEFDEVRQVRLARAGLAAARSEALLCKQSHAVEQAITGRVGRAIHAQQRLVDQAAEQLQRLRVVESECGADRSSPAKRAGTHEDTQTAQQRLFVLRQQRETPLDKRAQRLMPSGPVGVVLGQAEQATLHADQQLLG